MTTPAASPLAPLAYAELGVDPAAVAALPQITPDLADIAKTIKRGGQPKVTRRITAGKFGAPDVKVDTEHTAPYGPGADLVKSWPLYLQSSDSPSAARVLVQYRSISRGLAAVLPIEAFCLAAGVSPLTIKGILVGEIVRRSGEASTIIAAINHPRVVQKTVEMALTDDGYEDRNTLHKAVGFLPQPKGAQTTITVQQNATAAANAQSAGAPTPESTIRKLADRFNADRGTTAPLEIAQTASAGGEAIDEATFAAPADDRETVLIDDADADDGADDV